ncbi:MAG TPA: serine/threonine-protein kinase [Polyangiaceae bacterium]|nr:serine/threonine-protein kinase [Polyangiaceae bacterium]
MTRPMPATALCPPPRGRSAGARALPAVRRMTAKEQLRIGEVIPGTPYRVIRLLGSGGMGTVYEVEHQELGKRFVLKTLLSELSTRADLVQRLRTEWRALGKLEHPNIVRVSDAGVAEGKFPYFVMERLMGETLADRLARQRKLPVELALQISIGVLDALSVAHNIGIIHRDVKPPNIFVTEHDVPKLLDFGIAKLVDASSAVITARGVAVGTPRYMSPEQAAGDPVDARADLYAVGLVLYEMISGAGPYRVNDANEMFLAHLTQPAPPLSSQAARVSLELDAITASLLAKLPAERPSSAKAAAQALRAVLALYPKPGATPLVSPALKEQVLPTPAARSAVAVTVTGAISDATTRPGDVQRMLEAPTKHFGPQVVQTTHAGETLRDIKSRVTIDERAGRIQRRSDPPQSRSDTVHLADDAHGSGRRSDRPAASGSPLAATRTSAFPAAAEGAVTPPPVTRAATNEVYRRWLFPALVVVLAVVAVVLSRRPAQDATPADAPTPAVMPPPAAVAPARSAAPVVPAPNPIPVSAPAGEEPIAATAKSAPSAPASSSSAQSRSVSSAPIGKAGPGKTARRAAELLPAEPAFDLEASKKTEKPAPAPAPQPSHPALPPSGL